MIFLEHNYIIIKIPHVNLMAMYLDRLSYRRNYQYYLQVVMVLVVTVIILYAYNMLPFMSTSIVSPTSPVSTETCHAWEISHVMKQNQCKYRPKFPLSNPLFVNDGKRYKIAVIADLDEERSKIPGAKYGWQSYFKTGYLTKSNNGKYEVEWTDIITLTTKINEKGRGLELSELCVFNRRIYSVDDRTGIVYQILNGKAIPWVILMDGDGTSEKGFKSEWMTVKDGVLFIGGLGKEWTTKSGEFLNYNPLFVKSIDQHGGVMHHNWTDNFLKIRAKAGIVFPGYMVHEAVMWSNIKKRWYFLPRRMSTLKYDDTADERRGTNILISSNEDFSDIKVLFVGKLEPTHGFSSFKFVPGTGDDVAVALKTKEVEGSVSSYIMVFNVNTGKVIMSEQFIANSKYEGVEFI